MDSPGWNMKSSPSLTKHMQNLHFVGWVIGLTRNLALIQVEFDKISPPND